MMQWHTFLYSVVLDFSSKSKVDPWPLWKCLNGEIVFFTCITFSILQHRPICSESFYFFIYVHFAVNAYSKHLSKTKSTIFTYQRTEFITVLPGNALTWIIPITTDLRRPKRFRNFIFLCFEERWSCRDGPDRKGTNVYLRSCEADHVTGQGSICKVSKEMVPKWFLNKSWQHWPRNVY